MKNFDAFRAEYEVIKRALDTVSALNTVLDDLVNAGYGLNLSIQEYDLMSSDARYYHVRLRVIQTVADTDRKEVGEGKGENSGDDDSQPPCARGA